MQGAGGGEMGGGGGEWDGGRAVGSLAGRTTRGPWENYTRVIGSRHSMFSGRDGGTEDCHARGRGNVVSVSGDGEVWQMSPELTVGCERFGQREKVPRVPGPHVACLVRSVQGMLQ